MAQPYLPFLISVGQSGAFQDNMKYATPFDTKEEFGLWIKHVPFTPYPKNKELVTQSWADEQGEDVYLSPNGVMSEAYDLEVEFVYYASDGLANERIQAFIDRIKGKWLRIYDCYTRMGRQGVYLEEFGSDPTFQRRGLKDTVLFKVKFRVNDPQTNIILTQQ